MMAISNSPPCKECEDRHNACWDKCAKYAHWKAECQRMKALQREYKKQWREDYIRSELCNERKLRYVKSKYGR